jgi:cell wall-associated NlpC family hydrolase
VATKGVSGPALGVAASGAFLVYIGIKGSNPVDELRAILRGTSPSPLPRQSAFSGLSLGEQIAGVAYGAVAGGALLQSATKYLGVRYLWGGTTSKGLDCSGLVWRAAKDLGSPIARFTTATIPFSKYVTRVPQPSPGDIIVWPGDHMGIAAGGNRMLNAPHTGAVVRYDTWTPVRSGRSALYLRLKLPSTAGDSVPGGRGGV